MATIRSWRSTPDADGPFAIRPDDIPALNGVFSDAFSERYRRDGMIGVRVPHLNPAIWRYAVEDAGGGAMLWRGARGEIAAFNIAHLSGTEGWMGPLAVRPETQGAGLGKAIVRAGVDWLRQGGARVVGLETMPRTMDNIGFYSGLGFVPGRLTFTLTMPAAAGDGELLLGRLLARDQDDLLARCRDLAHDLVPGVDFTRELQLTGALGLGDTVLLAGPGGAVDGFAVCHAAPLVEGRAREELRVLKLALRHEALMPRLVAALADYARRSGTRRLAIRVQGEYVGAYRWLVAAGARVRWTDLRMTVAGHEESRAAGDGVVLSNWEI